LSVVVQEATKWRTATNAPVRHQRWASRFIVDPIALAVIQFPKPEPRIMRYELTDYEWATIKSLLPNKSRGVPRINDRRVGKHSAKTEPDRADLL